MSNIWTIFWVGAMIFFFEDDRALLSVPGPPPTIRQITIWSWMKQHSEPQQADRKVPDFRKAESAGGTSPHAPMLYSVWRSHDGYTAHSGQSLTVSIDDSGPQEFAETRVVLQWFTEAIHTIQGRAQRPLAEKLNTVGLQQNETPGNYDKMQRGASSSTTKWTSGEVKDMQQMHPRMGSQASR